MAPLTVVFLNPAGGGGWGVAGLEPIIGCKIICMLLWRSLQNRGIVRVGSSSFVRYLVMLYSIMSHHMYEVQYRFCTQVFFAPVGILDVSPPLSGNLFLFSGSIRRQDIPGSHHDVRFNITPVCVISYFVSHISLAGKNTAALLYVAVLCLYACRPSK